MLHAATLNDVFTGATLLFAALKILPVIILGANKGRVVDLFSNPVQATLYFTSKASGVLVVAFAMAAAASAGKVVEAYVLAALLIAVTTLTCWSVLARITGRFYGLAQIGRPA